jgi:hypothetical protein
LAGVLTDVESGTCSVLEHGYLTLVERPHGLPRGQRQTADVGRAGRIYRDVSYAELMHLELDGRMFHQSADARDRDFDRDLETLVDGQITTRLSYGQVFARPCWTARQVAVLLQQRGWTGSPVTCAPDCTLGG